MFGRIDISKIRRESQGGCNETVKTMRGRAAVLLLTVDLYRLEEKFSHGTKS